MEETKRKESKTTPMTNKDIAKKLAKNPSWVLTHLELDELSNVIEIAQTMLPEKVKKEIETREKELQKLKEKYN